MSQFKSWDEEVAELREKKAREEAEAAARREDELVAFETAPVRPRLKRNSWGLIRLACVIGLAGTCALGVALFERFWQPARSRDAPGARASVSTTGSLLSPRQLYPGMPEYAARILEDRFAEEGIDVLPEDNEKLASLVRESREHLSRCASSMPPREDSEAFLAFGSALSYFDKKDMVDVWISCLDGAQPFRKEGTTPRDILIGAVRTMKRLSVEPDRKQSLRHFVVLYTSFREEERLDHQGTLDMIVDLRKF
jgi:hypothetical protein